MAGSWQKIPGRLRNSSDILRYNSSVRLEVAMRKYFLLLVLGMMATAQPSHAQFNIQSPDGSVSIGPNGINVQQGNQSVRMNGSGISVDKPGESVRIKPTSIKTTKSKTVTTTVKSPAASALTLAQRVEALEIATHGKVSAGSLISRVQKLEMDTIGSAGTGTLAVRITKIENSLGNVGNVPERVVVSTKSASVKSHAVSSSTGGKDITLNNSNYEGTIACSGGNVTLNASHCEIKFTGHINSLVINGSGNDIACDTVNHVAVNGSSNDVKWSRAVNPSIADSGSANTLESQ